MSELRDQLQAARREYESNRYPGDLASDVLRRQSQTRRPWMWWAVPAIAAAIAIAIVLHRPGKLVPPDEPSPSPVIVVQVSPELLAPASPGLPGEASFMPAESSLIPPTQSLLAPAVPSLWETSTSDTTEPSTKESV